MSSSSCYIDIVLEFFLAVIGFGSSTPSTAVTSILMFLERCSLFIFSNLFGISWNTESIFSGTATIEDQTKFLACTLIMCHSVPFFGMNVIYESLPLFFSKKTLAKWRANGEQFSPRSLVAKAFLYVVLFHIVISLFIYHFGAKLLISSGFVSSFAIADLPTSFLHFFGQLVICLFVGDFCFFVSHRALHELPFAYQFIHVQHHEVKITFGLAAEYAAPLELIFGNIFVVLAGPLLFRFHAVVWFSFLALAIHSTTQSHSGYWYPSGNLWFHDMHHRINNVGNFSSLGIWDRIFGTDKAWSRKKLQEQQQNSEKVIKIIRSSKSREKEV